MKPTKRKTLERAGWRLVSTEEFLELSEAEQALIEIKLALTEEIRHSRPGSKSQAWPPYRKETDSKEKIVEKISSSTTH